jgi:4-carboxymuconolactone decarboxylase
VWPRTALSRRHRRFVTLPCVAAADAEGPLRDHVYAALNSGDLSIVEIRETVLHFAVYAGWPKASRFNIMVDEQWDRIHRERGLTPPAPEPLLPLPTPRDPEERLLCGEQSFRDINCIPFAPTRDNPYSGAGILNFVFGEMWLRPGLGMKERRLVTVACVAFQDAPLPILSHVYAALKSRDVSFEEMDELALHFAAYYGWPKAANLNPVIGEQKQRVLEEWEAEA